MIFRDKSVGIRLYWRSVTTLLAKEKSYLIKTLYQFINLLILIMKFKFKLNIRAVVLITISIAVIMFTSSIVELNQSKEEIFQLLNEHSSTLLESVIQSSNNTLNTSYEIEDLITEKLLTNARLIRKLDSLNVLDRDELIKIGLMNKLYRINIFDTKGNRILSNRIPEPGHVHGEENINRYDEIAPILKGETNELIIGLKNAEFSSEERFAVAVARSFNKGAIVVNLDAQSFLEFRKKIGIGKILQEMTKHHGIEYIVLQDSIGILAASEQIDTLESISNSNFLSQAMTSDSISSRIIEFGGNEIYEVVKRFKLDGEVIGLYRLGVTLEDVKNVESRMLRRLVIISIILAAISIIVLSIIFTTQNLKMVSDEYKKFKTLSSSVLENMSEAVLVTDKDLNITLFNKSSQQLFNLSEPEIGGVNILKLKNNLLGLKEEYFFLKEKKPLYIEREISYDNQHKYLLIGITYTSENVNTKNFIIVIKDLTQIKTLEEEARKNEKLLAMGELASGVAHEIRNPINAIGMIAFRLNQEFVPESNKEEYSDIIKVLKNEVDRINRIITQFLSYAKPLEIKKAEININKFLNEIRNLFESQAKLKKINFIISGKKPETVWFDYDLIKQALINVVQNALNAFDTIDDKSTVEINYREESDNLVIVVTDNGSGIPDSIQSRIFDLYFTTRKDGNGLGLSIVQKIIGQHNGSIKVNSKLNTGTTFKITLPKK